MTTLVYHPLALHGDKSRSYIIKPKQTRAYRSTDAVASMARNPGGDVWIYTRRGPIYGPFDSIKAAMTRYTDLYNGK